MKRRLHDRLFDEQTGKCYYCQESLDNDSHTTTIDHMIPLALGGKDNRRNRVLACADCNALKRGTTPKGFAESVREATLYHLDFARKLMKQMAQDNEWSQKALYALQETKNHARVMKMKWEQEE